MEGLPDEAIQQIFSTLTARDLLHAIWTCSPWRHVLQANQDWWDAWYERRWPESKASSQSFHRDLGSFRGCQQRALTRGLHVPWRFKPVTSKRLLYCGVGGQVGWTRRGHPPAVLVEGEWALLTCTPDREGPTGGRDRLQLVKLAMLRNEKEKQIYRTTRNLEQHWLDFGTNKYTPYALQGGATDLHMPFIVQGRASDVVVWKANQQYPIAVLHQAHGITVPAVAIERSPWGQQPQAEALRLASCSDTGKVSVWRVEALASHTLSESEPLWEGLPSDLCNKPGEACKVGALAMWTLCRPTEEGRNACCIAIGTDHLGVLLLSLTFHQHGLKGVKSQGVRLLPHTASVLSMCVAWDYTPPVCPFPASTTCADAAMPHQGSASGSAPGEGAMVQDAPADGLDQGGVPGGMNGLGGMQGDGMGGMLGGGTGSMQAGGMDGHNGMEGFQGGMGGPGGMQGGGMGNPGGFQGGHFGGQQHVPLGGMQGFGVLGDPGEMGGAPGAEGGGHGGIGGLFNPTGHDAAAASSTEQAESSTAEQQSSTNEQQGSADVQAAQQHSNDSLAASCDRTHLYVIWGLTPLPPALAPAASPLSGINGSQIQSAGNAQHLSRAAQSGFAASQAGVSSSSQMAGGALADSAQNAAAQNTDHNLSDRDSVLRHGDFRGLTGPDDLVASLRRLRPHLHASAPFSPQSATPAAAKGVSGASGPPRDPDVDPRGGSELGDSTGHISKQSKCDDKQDLDVPNGSNIGNVNQRGMPADGADQSALSHAAASGSTDITAHEGPDSTSAGEAQHAQHATARPPWSCLKAACTAQQLKALHQYCCTVACFDIFERLSEKADQAQGCRSEDCRSEPGCEEHPPQHQGCRAKPLWSHPVIAAASMSAGDGAVAVACSDGMLLLLDQASGNLIRRIPNSQLDQRFLQHRKSPRQQKSLAGVNSPWLDPSPVLHCTVWWGHVGSSTAPSDHGLTVVTELPLAHAASSIPKELRIDRYSCAEKDVPLCKCDDRSSAVLRTTVLPQVASFADVEQQESVLLDIQDGIGNPLSNLYGIGVQLPHQHAARRYFACGQRTVWCSNFAGCMFAEFFD